VKGLNSKGRGGKGGEGSGRKWRQGAPHYANSWIRPCFMSVLSIPPKQPGLIPPLVGYPTPCLSWHLNLTVHTRVLEYWTRYSIQSRIISY